MESELTAIDMYWWEGFYGFNNVLQRMRQWKRPYVRNFGDLLSPFIVSLLASSKVRHITGSGKFLALGSIFFALSDKDIVWGSGFLNARHIQFALACQAVNYLAVRGPETQKLLTKHAIPCPEVYGDPAILLPHLIHNDIEKRYHMGIVPHFSQYQTFKKIINSDSMLVIDVEQPVVEVIRQLLACEIILATSLHGLIVAEAYNIPSLLILLDKPLHGDLFKFEDYFHASNRTLHYAQFNLSKLTSFADLAIKQKQPQFDTNKLLAAFPFKVNHSRLDSDLLRWSKMQGVSYRHSIIPPKFKVP